MIDKLTLPILKISQVFLNILYLIRHLQGIQLLLQPTQLLKFPHLSLLQLINPFSTSKCLIINPQYFFKLSHQLQGYPLTKLSIRILYLLQLSQLNQYLVILSLLMCQQLFLPISTSLLILYQYLISLYLSL